MIKDVDDKVDNLKSSTNLKFKEVDRIIDKMSDDIDKIKDRLSQLEAGLKSLMQRVENLDVKIQSVKNRAGIPQGNSNNASQGEIDHLFKQNEDLSDAIGALKLELAKLRDDTNEKFNEVVGEINKKANKDEVEDEFRNVHDRIDHLEKALAKAKSDLKRAIRILEERVS